jgi:hypothetical protein
MTSSKRQALLQHHFGQCGGRQPFIPMPNIMYYITDTMHNLLRVVPQIFLHTVQENCDGEHLKHVRQWCYEKLSLSISDDIYHQTAKGVKKKQRFRKELDGVDMPIAP